MFLGIGLSTVLIAYAARSASASGPYGEQGRRMSYLRMSAESYAEQFGAYPVSDEHSTWYEKLKEADFARLDDMEETEDGSLPVDIYGFAMVYELPAAGQSSVVIRSVGRNGVDDGGALDDWDIRYGPNWGYWYKEDFPDRLRQLIIWAAYIVVTVVLVLWRIRPMRTAVAVICVTLGLSAFLLPPADTGSYHTSDHPWHFVWGLTVMTTITGLIGLCMLAERAVAALVRRVAHDDEDRNW